MPRRARYLLTPTARRQLREAKAWSLNRWGEELTAEYFRDLDAAVNALTANLRKQQAREELAGGTGLSLYAVRQHYLDYEVLPKNRLVIVAVLRQERDIGRILNKGKHVIARELDALRGETKNK